MRHLERLSTSKSDLWIKQDDLVHSLYGGNKVRKMRHLLEAARARGASRIVTLGAVGSHHVLTAAVFARDYGINVEAVVLPQPATPHVVENLRAALAQGVRFFPASSRATAVGLVLARIARGAHYVPPGGSNTLGARGFVDAAAELARQVQDGELPEPDLIVVAMGSGGTAAGLVTGLALQALKTRVLAVTVAEPAWLLERNVRSLTKKCTSSLRASAHGERLEHTRRYLGQGYGYATSEGHRATLTAAASGVRLDPTYTAKAFAAALDRVSFGRERTILYWHTLSSAPMSPLLSSAPAEADIGPELTALLL